MKTRKKLFIILPVIVVLILIILWTPEVFLIFHLDKYETSEACDAIEGKWDWFNDTCKIDFDDEKFCKDIGGTPSCSNRCIDTRGMNPFGSMGQAYCLSLCTFTTCEFEDPNVMKIILDTQSEFVYLQPDPEIEIIAAYWG